MSALGALVATTAIEVVILLVLLVPREVPARRVVAVGVVANVVTHPLLWWFVSRHDGDSGSYAVAVVAGELVVVAVEWLLLAVGLRRGRVPALDLLGIVVVANLVTTAIGLTIALIR
ncbi:MAG: hypothetical protein ABW122_15685 [Ilumatobacteraceae bacterium]